MKLSLFAVLMLLSQLLFAQPSLTKADLTAYVEAMQGLDALAVKYPEAVDKLESEDHKFQITDGGVSWAAAIRKAPFLSEVEAMLKASGFASVEAFTAKATQIMTSIIAVNMDDMKDEMEAAAKEMASNIEQMRQMGLSEDMMAQIQAGLEEANTAMAEAKRAQAMATESDKALVRSNIAMLEDVFSGLDDETSELEN